MPVLTIQSAKQVEITYLSWQDHMVAKKAGSSTHRCVRLQGWSGPTLAESPGARAAWPNVLELMSFAWLRWISQITLKGKNGDPWTWTVCCRTRSLEWCDVRLHGTLQCQVREAEQVLPLYSVLVASDCRGRKDKKDSKRGIQILDNFSLLWD